MQAFFLIQRSLGGVGVAKSRKMHNWSIDELDATTMPNGRRSIPPDLLYVLNTGEGIVCTADPRAFLMEDPGFFFSHRSEE